MQKKIDLNKEILKVPCVAECPAHVDVPGYIALISAGDYKGAVNLIRKDNPFPTSCAFVCEHSCEANCRRNRIDSALNIRGLKKFAVDQVSAAQAEVPEPAESTGKKIAVVGGGPAGLTAAYYLSLMGHKVVIFEESEALGGMLRYGIPNYRLPKDRLDEDIQAILSTGNIEVHTGVSISKDISMDVFIKEYDAIYIAIGAQIGKKLCLEGAESRGVYSALDMLGEISRGNKPDYTGKKVAVIGGGNVAMDAARSAVRCGADKVTVVYRRSRDKMSALPEEIEGAIEEGVELCTMHVPELIETDNHGAVTAFYAKSEDGQSVKMVCDIILFAVGQDIMSQPFEAYINDYDKVFAGGDCVLGPATVIKVIAAAREASVHIDRYLGFCHDPDYAVTVPPAGQNQRISYERAVITERCPKERKMDFEGIVNGLSYEEAMLECKRCLRCDRVCRSV